MEAHSFFLILIGILLIARLFGELATRLHITPVIGDLLAGIVLVPGLPGWIEPTVIHGER